jgi:cellulose synthase/poly-beta-1,6-N-acetylglucosamine synthase-like glycosyltransferase
MVRTAPTGAGSRRDRVPVTPAFRAMARVRGRCRQRSAPVIWSRWVAITAGNIARGAWARLPFHAMLRLVASMAVLYPVMAALLVLGLRRLRRSRPAADAACPTASVVVSARNEMESLPRCVAALLELDYPRDRLQIILVNDRSTDGTGEWLDDLAAREPRVTVLHTARLPENGLEAKARGVAHGIAHSNSEWILITDADARVHRMWARHLLGAVNAQTAIVSGAANVVPRHWWGSVERVIWAFLQTVNVGGAGWGIPVVSVGPSMGIRRSAYVAAGGLEGARFKIAEDLAMFRMAMESGGQAHLYADTETTVQMDEVPTWLHVPSQLRRWVGGALEQGPAYSVGVPLALVWGVLVATFIVAGWLWWPMPWLAFVATKLTLDAALLRSIGARFGVPGLWRDALLLSAAQLVAVAFLPASLLVSRRMQWRGAGYAVKY